MSRASTESKQIYRSPTKREAHDLFIEENQDHYNEATQELIVKVTT